VRHIPLLRRGRPYRSLDVVRVPHYRTREAVAEVSQANAGLVARDLRPASQAEMQEPLLAMSAADLLALSARAARHLVEDTLPLGGEAQTPDDYVRQTSSTTGMPHVMVRRNLEKIRGVLANMPEVLSGLTRGLDLRVIDDGMNTAGPALSFVPRGHTLGVILPSNSPGVHALWTPAIALKTALVLKPGSAEPWTPYRIIQAFLRAGAPAEAFSYFPASHGAAAEVLRRSGRGMLFGDLGAVGSWKKDPRVELHGPGYSKVLLGPDAADRWERYLDVMVASVLENSGRSCVNASGIWTTAHGDAIAEALAERLAAVQPRDAEDEAAQLSPFADGRVAQRISGLVDDGLREPGAREVTAAHREGPRLVTRDGSTYLLPTIVRVDSSEHPLANREFLFPFASVVEVRPEELPAVLGPTLALTAITEDAALRRRLLAAPHVHRLNLGAVPTMKVSWDQPHEGNLFEHLYARRALQRAVP
jgi:acyl-CoA reductase-like NAD-dependent aldehyde dehydrogenase